MLRSSVAFMPSIASPGGSEYQVAMTLVIIPARLKSARLDNKPMQLIGGEPLIVHCWRRAVEADIGPVWVAADAAVIVEAIDRQGGKAVLTGEADCGSDRVAIAAAMVDPGRAHGIVINQQGDMPFLDAVHLQSFAQGLDMLSAMATAYCDLGVVRIADGDFHRETVRSHIGLYAFTRDALEQFRQWGPSDRERVEKLEQLRVVGRLDIRFIALPSMPMEVNTPDDLALANSILAAVGACSIR
ncbi:MAG: NTP transferase domain-containing protein [Pseudomonadota bacterium]|nr:NTP transferase domain-containing protein [Pseudomonadota bacterium]